MRVVWLSSSRYRAFARRNSHFSPGITVTRQRLSRNSPDRVRTRETEGKGEEARKKGRERGTLSRDQTMLDLAGPHVLSFGSFVSADRLLHPITCDRLKRRHVLHLPALSTNYRSTGDGGLILEGLPPDWRLRRIKVSARDSSDDSGFALSDTNFCFWSLSFPFVLPEIGTNFPSLFQAFAWLCKRNSPFFR